jgi:hypothetical protein
MRVHHLVTFGALLSIVGCARTPKEPAAEVVVPASATTAPTGRSQAQLIALLVGGVDSPAREYFMGDHLGMNRELLLLAGGGYSLKWTGFEGLDGAAIGEWRVEGAVLQLIASDEQGRAAEHPLRTLHLRVVPGTGSPVDVALVPDEALSTFTSEGVQDWTCFRASEIVLRKWLGAGEK